MLRQIAAVNYEDWVAAPPKSRPNSRSCPNFLFLFFLGKEAIKAIKVAIREFHRRTCVKFVLHTNEQDYLEFQGSYGLDTFLQTSWGK